MSLFDPPARSDVLTVSQLTTGLHEAVSRAFSDVEVEGELSNFSRARSGHCYFTLKDAEAQIDGVMWRSTARGLPFTPEDGMLVRVTADAAVYEPRGRLQVIVQRMKLAGEGALRQAFEQLKRRLEAEGLFATDRKRPLPTFPRVVGVVTSGAGAAVHDVRSVLERRFPDVRAVLASVPVQGTGAAERIAAAVRAFNRLPTDHPQRPDLLLVGRGGGSAEDLWAFNEEVVARALFDSTIPTVSCVGHETDVSIADFVADRRAATPTMAAEIAVPDRRELRARITEAFDAVDAVTRQVIADGRWRTQALLRTRGFHRPADLVHQHQQRIDDLVRRLARSGASLTDAARHRLDHVRQRLYGVDPEAPLRRGYAWAETPEGTPIRTAAQLAKGDRLRLRFADGTRPAVVTDGSDP